MFVWAPKVLVWDVHKTYGLPWHCNNFYRVSQFYWQGFQVVSSSFRISRFGIVLQVFHENQLSVGQWVALDCQYRAHKSVENIVLMLDCSNRVAGCRERYGKLTLWPIVVPDTTSCSVSILCLTIRILGELSTGLGEHFSIGAPNKMYPTIESKLPVPVIDSSGWQTHTS